jgi:hypothetical protein
MGTRFVQILKIFDFFIGLLNIDRVYKSQKSASATGSKADRFEDLPIISLKSANLAAVSNGVRRSPELRVVYILSKGYMAYYNNSLQTNTYIQQTKSPR